MWFVISIINPQNSATFRQLNARELDRGPPANAIGPRKTGTEDGVTNLPFYGWYKPSETIRMWVSTPSIVSKVASSCGFSDVYVHHFMVVYNTHKNDGL